MHERNALVNALREGFRKSGVKQSTLAAAAGVTGPTVSRWLSGQILLPPTRAPYVARALGLDEAAFTELAVKAFEEQHFSNQEESGAKGQRSDLEQEVAELKVRLEALEFELRSHIRTHPR